MNLPPGTLARDIDDPELADCPDCNGDGYQWRRNRDNGGKDEKHRCYRCDGEGKIAAAQLGEDER